MKKILPYILIFVIIANFLAPFSVGVNQNNNLKINKNKAEALFDNKIYLETTPYKTNSSIVINFTVAYSQKPALLTKQGVRATITDSTDGISKTVIVKNSDFTEAGTDGKGYYKYTGSIPFDDLSSNRLYSIETEARQINSITTAGINALFNFNSLWDPKNDSPYENVIFIVKTESSVTTSVSTAQTVQIEETKKSNNNKTETMPKCSFYNAGTWFKGCLAQGLYYVLFIPTSYLFALTGVFFDNTFAYSVQDSSYRSTFVVEGWAVVRDICNMFFIFILLYIAIGTILKLNGVKTKEMIVNVVIIGLFLNFSLFATQVIIDASNVLARVFYNADIIKISEKVNANGVTNSTPGLNVGPDGVIPLSAAIVNKVNPQKLIINSTQVGPIEDSAGVADRDADTVSTGTFVLVTLLTVAINIMGMITFISIGLIFVSRVIGLWVAMIIAPLAFLTYAVPSLKGAKMIGWEKWWPDTIKLAFLAPVFIFFMFIVLKFLETGLGMFGNSDKDGLSFVIATIIPFAFIMILLMKAKSIAGDMSGELGQKITGAVAAGGAMMLGGAAMGTAFLGRRVGAGFAGLSNSKYNQEKLEHDNKLEEWKRNGSIGTPPAFTPSKRPNLLDKIGEKYNKNQKGVEKIEHARHITDEAIAKADPSLKGKSWGNLSGVQKQKVMAIVKRDEASKYMDVKEREYREGHGLEKQAPLTTADESAILAKKEREVLATKGPGVVLLSPADKAEAKKQADAEITEERKRREKLPDLSSADKANIKSEAEKEAGTKFEEEIKHASQNINILSQAFAKANTGSWDVRNISQTTTDKRDGLLNNIPTKLIAGIAIGVRAGLKGSGINHGTGQADLIKDLGHTITEALKSVKIEVPKAPSGGGNSHGGAAAAGGHH